MLMKRLITGLIVFFVFYYCWQFVKSGSSAALLLAINLLCALVVMNFFVFGKRPKTSWFRHGKGRFLVSPIGSQGRAAAILIVFFAGVIVYLVERATAGWQDLIVLAAPFLGMFGAVALAVINATLEEK